MGHVWSRVVFELTQTLTLALAFSIAIQGDTAMKSPEREYWIAGAREDYAA